MSSQANAHVFISYSRRNIDFAKLLFEELSHDRREVWVDWEDIPRAADWMQEIYSGIDNSDTFIFLVSEHSLISEICNQELEYALQQNKKIIPLILQDIDDDVFARVDSHWKRSNWYERAHKNWDALKHLNWVFFNDPVRYNQEFKALLKAVDEDLAHIKAHTRLLVRAQEWVNANRNKSSLLAGDDIIRAENWLRNYATTEPLPTDLHRDFILASRRAENERIAYEASLQNRARIRLQILVGSFVIVILVIVLGLLPRINVILEEELAIETDERLAESALSFLDLLDDDEELARVSAQFVATQPIIELIGEENDLVADLFDRIRDDFGLQEISVYAPNYQIGWDALFYNGPDINHNERVQLARQQLIARAAETGEGLSRIVIGSPESQIIAAQPVVRLNENDEEYSIGIVLVAYHLNDDYVLEKAIILNVEAILANEEDEIVATTFEDPQTVRDNLEVYTRENDYDTRISQLGYFDYFTEEGDSIRMVSQELILNDGESEGLLYVGSSFESVRIIKEDIQATVFTFAGIISVVVVILLVLLIGIPEIRERLRRR